MVDQIEVEITGRAVLLPVGMVALVEVEIPGRAVLLVGVVALRAETTEVAEEALRQREILRKMWWLDDRTLQRGRTESLLAQVKDEDRIAMMVQYVSFVR